jgi:CubicO group peptidase (beta-lactamase class C family)
MFGKDRMIGRVLSRFAVLWACFSVSYGINYTALESYIAKARQDWGGAPVAIAIVEGDKITYLKTFGDRSVLTPTPLDGDTVFPIASLSKAFSALLLLKLAEQGKLNLDDPVTKYLPDFKLASEDATKGMTLAKLFQQRSGLPGFAFDTLAETGWSEQETFKVLDQIHPIDAFDARFEYQNVFPGLFGWIAEKVTGESLSTLFKREIFTPLGMESASLGEHGALASDGWMNRLWSTLTDRFKNWVSEHYLSPTGNLQLIKNGNPAIYKFSASRGINASLKDMAKWLQFWINGGVTPNGQHLVSPEHLHKMLAPLTPVELQGVRFFPKDRVTAVTYGMGWYSHNYASLKCVISHMGGMTGVRSLIAYVPDQKIGIVILSNVGGMRVNLMPEAIRSKFLDLVAGIAEERDWSAELRKDLVDSREQLLEERKTYRLRHLAPAKPLETYVGVYENKLYGQIEITAEGEPADRGEKLILHYRDLKVSLRHWNGDQFTFKANDFTRSYSETDYADLVFGEMDAANKAGVCIINLLYEGNDTRFVRKK